MTEPNNDLGELLSSFPDNTSVQFFNNARYIGIEIGVSRAGWGFGSITLSHNLKEGTWHLDDECSGRERDG